MPKLTEVWSYIFVRKQDVLLTDQVMEKSVSEAFATRYERLSVEATKENERKWYADNKKTKEKTVCVKRKVQ